jgi:hypothetical protein
MTEGKIKTKLNYRKKKEEAIGSTNKMGILFGQITNLIYSFYLLQNPEKKTMSLLKI